MNINNLLGKASFVELLAYVLFGLGRQFEMPWAIHACVVCALISGILIVYCLCHRSGEEQEKRGILHRGVWMLSVDVALIIIYVYMTFYM
ncbi:MAG: hypothetical protein Q4D56_12135 [Bacteroides sp.]|nr:hypothetical protein [Bacteroides sp.]